MSAIEITKILFEFYGILNETGTLKKIKRNIFPKANLFIEYGFKAEIMNDRIIIERNLYENDKTGKYRKEKMLEIIQWIIQLNATNSKKVIIKSGIPIPMLFALGYFQKTWETLDYDKRAYNFDCYNYSSNHETVISKNENLAIRNNEIKIFIGESKIKSDSSFHYAILPSKENIRWSFSKKSLRENLYLILKEIENLDKNIKTINFSMISSPSTAFFIGQIMQEKKYEVIVEHYNSEKKKSIKNIKISNTTLEFI